MEIIFNNRFDNQKYDNIIHVNDRLAKDVDVLMNSTYWINALKSRKAIGIGEQLYIQLAEAQNFLKGFIKFCIVSKRFFLKSIQKNEKMINSSDIFENMHLKFIENLNSININNNCPNNTKLEFSFKSKYFIFHTQFIVECIILAILDSDDYIGTVSGIIYKITEWFPELKKPYENKIKPFIEYILNTIPCFKRLMNSTNANSLNRPIILGKRQYIWSVDTRYLRNFVKHFSKQVCWREMNINEQNDELFDYDSVLASFIKVTNDHMNDRHNEMKLEKLSLMDAENLFNDWKYKIEKFKLLMQIKHNNNGFIWLDRLILKQNDEILNMFEFMKFEKNFQIKKPSNSSPRLNCVKFNEKLLFENCENNNHKRKKISRVINTNSIEKICGKKNLVKPNITKVASSSKSKSSLLNCLETNLDCIYNHAINRSSTSSISSSISSSIYSNELIQTSPSIIDVNSFLKNKQNDHENNNELIETNSVTPTQQSDNIYNLLNITSFSNGVYNFSQNDLHVPQCVVDSSVEELLNNDFRTVGDLEKFMFF